MSADGPSWGIQNVELSLLQTTDANVEGAAAPLQPFDAAHYFKLRLLFAELRVCNVGGVYARRAPTTWNRAGRRRQRLP